MQNDELDKAAATIQELQADDDDDDRANGVGGASMSERERELALRVHANAQLAPMLAHFDHVGAANVAEGRRFAAMFVRTAALACRDDVIEWARVRADFRRWTAHDSETELRAAIAANDGAAVKRVLERFDADSVAAATRTAWARKALDDGCWNAWRVLADGGRAPLDVAADDFAYTRAVLAATATCDGVNPSTHMLMIKRTLSQLMARVRERAPGAPSAGAALDFVVRANATAARANSLSVVYALQPYIGYFSALLTANSAATFSALLADAKAGEAPSSPPSPDTAQPPPPPSLATKRAFIARTGSAAAAAAAAPDTDEPPTRRRRLRIDDSSDTESESESESKPETEPKTKPESEPKSKPNAESKSKSDAKSKSKSDAEPEAERASAAAAAAPSAFTYNKRRYVLTRSATSCGAKRAHVEALVDLFKRSKDTRRYQTNAQVARALTQELRRRRVPVACDPIAARLVGSAARVAFGDDVVARSAATGFSVKYAIEPRK